LSHHILYQDITLSQLLFATESFMMTAKIQRDTTCVSAYKGSLIGTDTLYRITDTSNGCFLSNSSQ